MPLDALDVNEIDRFFPQVSWLHLIFFPLIKIIHNDIRFHVIKFSLSSKSIVIRSRSELKYLIANRLMLL